MTKSPIIGYAGMTHLGLCSAIAAASKGFSVLGFDPDTDLVRGLDTGTLPVVEPDLGGLLLVNRACIRFTADPARIGECDLVYIAPDVPTDDAGKSDLAGLN